MSTKVFWDRLLVKVSNIRRDKFVEKLDIFYKIPVQRIFWLARDPVFFRFFARSYGS